MTITDAELLDIVRRLRTYVSSMDNVHHILTTIGKFDDVVPMDITPLTTDISNINARVIKLLKAIESSRAYKDMVVKFTMAAIAR